jgi:hypothetical protein
VLQDMQVQVDKYFNLGRLACSIKRSASLYKVAKCLLKVSIQVWSVFVMNVNLGWDTSHKFP